MEGLSHIKAKIAEATPFNLAGGGGEMLAFTKYVSAAGLNAKLLEAGVFNKEHPLGNHTEHTLASATCRIKDEHKNSFHPGTRFFTINLAPDEAQKMSEIFDIHPSYQEVATMDEMRLSMQDVYAKAIHSGFIHGFRS